MRDRKLGKKAKKLGQCCAIVRLEYALTLKFESLHRSAIFEVFNDPVVVAEEGLYH
jgi:hypothetical protein